MLGERMKRNINDIMPSELPELAKQSPGYIKGKGNGDIEWVSCGSTLDDFKMEELKSGLDHE